jgi:hypothetical protein
MTLVEQMDAVTSKMENVSTVWFLISITQGEHEEER